MRNRTVTRGRTIFSRTGPEAVTYDLSQPNLAIITVPPTSKWTSQPHWHETHTEYLQIVQGKALVTLGTSTRGYEPRDGVIEVKRGQIHEWRRSDHDPQSEDLVLKEWTDPADGQKEVFFRMLNSVLTEPEPARMHNAITIPLLSTWLEGYVVPLQLLTVFAACDNCPVILNQQGVLGWVLTHLILGFATILGGFVLGLKPLYDEYISDELRARLSMRRLRGAGQKST